jgi:3-ketosteroid 9alpha-monooxygenase subunit B
MRAFAEHFLSYDAFVCGPGPFMSGVVQVLKDLGFPRERRHQEKFVSLGGNPFGDEVEDVEVDEEEVPETLSGGRTSPATLVGVLDGQAFELDGWPADKPILDHLLAKGLQAPFSCREGNCSACACRVLEGEVWMRHNEVLDEEDLADGIRLACQSLPVSDTVRISYE